MVLNFPKCNKSTTHTHNNTINSVSGVGMASFSESSNGFLRHHSCGDGSPSARGETETPIGYSSNEELLEVEVIERVDAKREVVLLTTLRSC